MSSHGIIATRAPLTPRRSSKSKNQRTISITPPPMEVLCIYHIQGLQALITCYTYIIAKLYAHLQRPAPFRLSKNILTFALFRETIGKGKESRLFGKLSQGMDTEILIGKYLYGGKLSKANPLPPSPCPSPHISLARRIVGNYDWDLWIFE